MKKLLFTLLIFSCINAYSQHPEKYFKFIEPNKESINTKITKLISIDKVVKDTVWAYANLKEFENFQKLGYKIELLTPPSLVATKALNMATDISQMTNWDRYPTYAVYREMIKKFETDYPNLCKLDSIGTTVEGRKLYVVKISDNVNDDEAEQEFFYTSTMHGDEVTGYVLMLRLTDYLLSQYNTNTRVKDIVDNMAIYINPNANPDGTYYAGNNTVSGSIRNNANGVNINRNFPDPRAGIHPDGNSWQPETQAMMNFASQHRFTASANFHGGIELANYPWDTWESIERKHADHNWYYTVSRAYADTVQKYSPSGYFTGEDNGVTHGGDWYVVEGGRQDYMNYWHHCREITLEISDIKLLSSDLLPAHWDYNKESILNYMEICNGGIQGIIKDEDNNPIKAKVYISAHDKDSSEVYSNSTNGFYARPIEPGTWDVTYSALGYESKSQSITVTDLRTKIIQDITLPKLKYEVTFEVKHNGNALANAIVTLNGSAAFTNSEGKAVFSNFPYGKGYSYNVSATNYVTVEGQTDVTANKTIPINIYLVNADELTDNKTISVFPNPFSESINIALQLDKPDFVEVSVYSLDGKQIFRTQKTNYNSGDVRIYLPTSSMNTSLNSGNYIVKVSTSEKNYSRVIQYLP